MKRVALIVMMAVLLIITGQQFVLNSEASEKPVEKAAVSKTADWAVKEAEETDIQLTHEEIIQLTDRFMDELVQPVDQGYKVINYQSREAFIEDFTKLASHQVAEKYIHTYYIQKEDGLYVIPTSTPPWFEKEQTYTTEKTSENTVKVSQQNISDLHGSYIIELEFMFKGKWRITDTEYDYQ